MLTEDELAARKAAVSKIELMFTIGRNSKNSAVVNTLAAELHPKESPQPPDGTLVTAGIISADNATAYYLWFHIDKLDAGVLAQHRDAASAQVKGGKRKGPSEYFVHIVFEQRPSSPPPKAYTIRRNAGQTLEWALTALQQLPEPSAALARANFLLDRATTPKHLGLPIASRGDLLEVTAAEYQPTSDRSLVRRFRWTREPDALKVELTYRAGKIYPLVETWERQTDNATGLLKGLL